MTYTKPEVSILGDAAYVIQGAPKDGGSDAGSLTVERTIESSEFSD